MKPTELAIMYLLVFATYGGLTTIALPKNNNKRGSERRAPFTTDELTAAEIDAVGLGSGVVPSTGAGRGEQMWVRATLPAATRPGRVQVHPDWGTAKWFNADGHDTQRDMTDVPDTPLGLTLTEPLGEPRTVWLAFDIIAHGRNLELRPISQDVWYHGDMPARLHP